LTTECKVAVTASERIVEEAQKLKLLDPCQDPLRTLAALSCKISYLTMAGRYAETRMLRSLLYNLYAIYSQNLGIVVDEVNVARGFKTVIVKSAGCEVEVEVSTSGTALEITVDGCDIVYKCSCSPAQTPPENVS